MINLKKIIHNTNKVLDKPLILNLASVSDKNKFINIIKNNPNIIIVDDFIEQLKELFAINNPELYFDSKFENYFNIFINQLQTEPELLGRWIYFPWLNTISHVLEERDFFKVRTSRNKLLITESEQIKFYNSTIGIAGLSIGNSVAISITLQGGAKNIRLADFDNLALSNTNRIHAGVNNLGLKKTQITARQIYEINPYANIEIYNTGINQQTIEKFLNNLDLIIDEVDSIATKILIRKKAKEKKIPIIMGADNADMAVVDIERYDIDPKQKIFNGRIKEVKTDNLTKRELGGLIAQLIGFNNHTPEMFNSLTELGKTLISWPQLGGTAMLNGSAVAFCARKILCNKSQITKRGIVSLEPLFIKNFHSKKQQIKRNQAIKNFKLIFKK